MIAFTALMLLIGAPFAALLFFGLLKFGTGLAFAASMTVIFLLAVAAIPRLFPRSDDD
jgi:hypothetical protein